LILCLPGFCGYNHIVRLKNQSLCAIIAYVINRIRLQTTTERKLCDNQLHSFHLSGMNISALSRINTCGVNAGMAQNICQSAQIFFYCIERPGKQMAEIMRKYFFRINIGTCAEIFHFSPYIASIQGLACPCYEHWTGGSFLFFEISG